MPAITVKITLELEVEVEGASDEWEVTDIWTTPTTRVPYSKPLQPLWDAIYAQASDTIQDAWED